MDNILTFCIFLQWWRKDCGRMGFPMSVGHCSSKQSTTCWKGKRKCFPFRCFIQLHKATLRMLRNHLEKFAKILILKHLFWGPNLSWELSWALGNCAWASILNLGLRMTVDPLSDHYFSLCYLILLPVQLWEGKKVGMAGGIMSSLLLFLKERPSVKQRTPVNLHFWKSALFTVEPGQLWCIWEPPHLCGAGFA